MQIHKITFPPSALIALPPDQLSAFLLLGHFLTEANWLQKLLLYASQDESGNVAEKHARMALSLMVSKIFAAKIHEGWNRLRTGNLRVTIDALALPDEIAALSQQLSERLAENSLIHKVRRSLAFHYPTELSLADLPGVAQSDVALYMTQHAGDTLSLISELSAAAQLNAITGVDHVGRSLDSFLKEVIAVSGLYSDFLHGTLAAMTDRFLPQGVAEANIENGDGPRLEDVRVRFFAIPPGAPEEG